MIPGTEGMSMDDLNADLDAGGKFVVYPYVISILILTFQRSSDVVYVRAEDSGIGGALPYMAITLLFGWWGIPWGFIYTPIALIQLLGGGKNVTAEVLASLR